MALQAVKQQLWQQTRHTASLQEQVQAVLAAQAGWNRAQEHAQVAPCSHLMSKLLSYSRRLCGWRRYQTSGFNIRASPGGETPRCDQAGEQPKASSYHVPVQHTQVGSSNVMYQAFLGTGCIITYPGAANQLQTRSHLNYPDSMWRAPRVRDHTNPEQAPLRRPPETN